MPVGGSTRTLSHQRDVSLAAIASSAFTTSVQLVQ
jgi:hypothetical protein